MREAPLFRPEPGDRVIDRHRLLMPGEPIENRHGTVLRATFFDVRVQWDGGDISSVGPFILTKEEDREDQDREDRDAGTGPGER